MTTKRKITLVKKPTANFGGKEPAAPTIADPESVNILNQAAAIQKERARQYDQPGGERSMAKTVAAFNTITGQDMTEAEGWEFLNVLKQVRLFNNKKSPSIDSAVDGVSYGALLAECVKAKGL